MNNEITQKRMAECLKLTLKAMNNGHYYKQNSADMAFWIQKLGGLASAW